MKTEEAIYSEAVRIKKASPDTKVIFYLATDLGKLDCYAANTFWQQQTQWHLRNDTGGVIAHNGIPMMDYT